MSGQWFWLPERVPSRNELDDMRIRTATRFSNKKGRNVRWNAYSDFKRKFHGRVAIHAKAQGIEPAPEPAVFTYVFFEPDRRRDPSNFTSSGQKLIEDALQQCGVLAGDGWKHVAGFRHYWSHVEHKSHAGCGVFIARYLIPEEKAAIAAASALREAKVHAKAQ